MVDEPIDNNRRANVTGGMPGDAINRPVETFPIDNATSVLGPSQLDPEGAPETRGAKTLDIVGKKGEIARLLPMLSEKGLVPSGASALLDISTDGMNLEQLMALDGKISELKREVEGIALVQSAGDAVGGLLAGASGAQGFPSAAQGALSGLNIGFDGPVSKADLGNVANTVINNPNAPPAPEKEPGASPGRQFS